MPATVGRMLLLIPIVAALAARVGFAPNSTGYHGLMLCAIIISYQSGNGILPANAPNLVLAGAGEALYGVHLIYGEYLWVIFPVLCVLKGVAAVALIYWLFPAEVESAATPVARAPMSAEEKRLAVILIVAIVLWATDFAHGIRAGDGLRAASAREPAGRLCAAGTGASAFDETGRADGVRSEPW